MYLTIIAPPMIRSSRNFACFLTMLGHMLIDFCEVVLSCSSPHTQASKMTKIPQCGFVY